MLICDDSACRENHAGPAEYTFFGECTVEADGSIYEGPDDARCTECEGTAQWCDYCTNYEFCDEHRVIDSGRVHTEPFSSNVNWIDKSKKILAAVPPPTA